MTRLTRWLGYFAALRPSFVFGALIAVLPLAALPGAPLGSMIGNLFVDYSFLTAFWFGMVLFGAVWAVMLTAGLGLDAERDRHDSWVHDPVKTQPPGTRWVTVPIGRVSVFLAFTALALPGALAIVGSSPQKVWAAAGLLLGGLTMYVLTDFAISFLSLGDRSMRVLPWQPLILRLLKNACGEKQLHWLGGPARVFVRGAAGVARFIGVPDSFFAKTNGNTDHTRLLPDHTFAAWAALFVLAVYLLLYETLRPGGAFYRYLDRLPPAGFLYLLLILLVLVVSIIWVRFRRYRLALYVVVVWLLAVKLLQGWGPPEGTWWLGNPVHTYDVYRHDPATRELTTTDVLAPLVPGPDGQKPTLIVVAASGGGILAAGWTTKVLSELQAAYPPLRRELRLISAVSGGSVGTVHYVRAHDDTLEPLAEETLKTVVKNSLETSLAATAYGLTFPDFHRHLFPFAVPEIDRGRLQELWWQDTARATQGQGERELELLSDWNDAVRAGFKPAVILNTTVMESGERIAITPLFSLHRTELDDPEVDWDGWLPRAAAEAAPPRRNGARTLSEFLRQPKGPTIAGYTMDVWTAARLSATFAYVSPPARARLRCRAEDAGCQPDELAAEFAPLHLIDGGYNENFGVTSALDWLTRAVRSCVAKGNCPFSRIALIEIRATPVGRAKPAASEWSAAWLGPALGLMNSWDFAQTSSNDTQVDRLLRLLRRLPTPLPFESFVFEPEILSDEAKSVDPAADCCKRNCCPNHRTRNRDFALSWHLSAQQKAEIDDYWLDPRNQCTLRAFLRFTNCGDATVPCAARGAEPSPCGQPVQSMRPMQEAADAAKQ